MAQPQIGNSKSQPIFSLGGIWPAVRLADTSTEEATDFRRLWLWDLGHRALEFSGVSFLGLAVLRILHHVAQVQQVQKVWIGFRSFWVHRRSRRVLLDDSSRHVLGVKLGGLAVSQP